MSDHVSTGRMHEALDGLLPAVEMEHLERHFAECAACRNDYAELREALASISKLSRSAAVPDGLWQGIEARITSESVRPASAPSGAAREVPVYRLPTGASATTRDARISLTVHQLVVAAALVAALSASVVWMGTDRSGVAPGTAELAAEEPGGAAARAVFLEAGRYAEVVGELERMLGEGAAVLAPETLASIEESLETINTAIEEIEAALVDDPNSDLLSRMLADRRQTRLGVLQRAAAAVQARS